jgi:L-lactate dehydrogenase (cytochrome)
MPVAIAPTGLTGMQHADGEILAARAAEKFGVPFTLSTMSICSIEDVAAHTKAPFWFQLYVMRDRDFIERLIDRAKAANCSALVLTLDLQILGQRHKDLKNGLSAPPKPTLANIINMATKPRWCLGMLGTRRHLRQHRRPRQGRGRHGLAVAWTASSSTRTELGRCRVDQEALGRQADPQGHPGRGGRRLAVASGADALIVSNHGGRQLDGAPSAIEALPAIVDPVGRRSRCTWTAASARARTCSRPGAGRARHLHRPRLPLRPGRHGRGRRDQGAGDHPQGTRPDHGALRTPPKPCWTTPARRPFGRRACRTS